MDLGWDPDSKAAFAGFVLGFFIRIINQLRGWASTHPYSVDHLVRLLGLDATVSRDVYISLADKDIAVWHCRFVYNILPI